MIKLFRFLFKALITLLLLSIVGIGVVVFLAFDEYPLLNKPSRLNAQSAKATEVLVERLSKTLASKRRPQVFSTNLLEISSSAALLSKAWEPLSSTVDISDHNLNISFWLKTPSTPLGNHLRFGLNIPESSEGLRVSTLNIGQHTIPGNWLLSGIVLLADWVIDNDTASQVIKNILQVHIQQEQLVLIMDSPRDMRSRLKQLSSRIKSLSGDLNLFSETELTRKYFQHLLTLEEHFPRGSKVTLEEILQLLFLKVQNDSSQYNAIEHNRSALFALGVYLGSYHFEKFIGTIAPEGYKGHKIPIQVTLSGRKDLRLHFVYSSTLQLLTEQSASVTIGEFKELLDSNTGGSGFSFIDLMADRAGILFSRSATETQKKARDFQFNVVLDVGKGLLPPLSDLKEGLSASEFEQLYDTIESTQYSDEIKAIDKMLSELPVFQP